VSEGKCVGKATLTPEFPEIRIGCQLREINGEPTTTKRDDGTSKTIMTIKDAAPMFKERPLRLKFSVPEHKEKRLGAWATSQWPSAEISHLPRWLREGGLRAIEQVKAHEKKKKRIAEGRADELAQALHKIEELERQLAGYCIPEADPAGGM
jgi:hypothetical protein